MTSCVPMISEAEVMPVGCILKVTHQGAALALKSDVYTYLVVDLLCV